jgi:hypothetical protein
MFPRKLSTIFPSLPIYTFWHLDLLFYIKLFAWSRAFHFLFTLNNLGTCLDFLALDVLFPVLSRRIENIFVRSNQFSFTCATLVLSTVSLKWLLGLLWGLCYLVKIIIRIGREGRGWMSNSDCGAQKSSISKKHSHFSRSKKEVWEVEYTYIKKNI